MSRGLESRCPQCGAPLRFGAGHSIVCVCEHCRSTIARVGVDVTRLGTMPDLVATDTRLALGCRGKLARLDFHVVGRVQLTQGRAVWDEWYLLWSDGSFGWLAEAQGRVIVSHRFEHPVLVPRFDSMRPGALVTLEGLGNVTIEEVGQAQVLSAEGELPFQPQLERSYRFIDATLPGDAYVTLDYGSVGDDAEVFVGRALSYAEAGIEAQLAPARTFAEPQARGEALACPSCAAPLSLRLRESESVVCESCHALCRATLGKFALIAALSYLAQPTLPLGARGRLFGQALEVIGWLQREVSVADERYTWNEYLLHGEQGYRWLSEADGHWTYLEPIAGANVRSDGSVAHFGGEKYKHFQTSAQVRNVCIRGEFYWQIEPDDRATLEDYVAPPHMLSLEKTEQESQWTRGEYVDARLLWTSFAQPGKPPPQRGVGPCQPNPHRKRARAASVKVGLGLVALALLSIALQRYLPHKRLIELDVPLAATNITISPPFEIEGAAHAVEIEAAVALTTPNTWVGLDLALIDDVSGESTALGIELSRYQGYDDGSYWSEDNSHVRERTGPIPPGRYVLRIEPQPQPGAQLPALARVRVTHGVFLWFPLVCALLLLLTPAFTLLVLSGAFEGRRWQQSDHVSEGGGSDD